MNALRSSNATDLSDATRPAIGSVSGQWSRRGFLGAVSATTLGVATGCGLSSSAVEESLSVPGGLSRRSGTKVGSDDDPAYTPVAPLALTADAELTEDYFVFQTHQIDPAKDTVIAYSRADGEVEAMLLQDGGIKQIYRDPTQPGGWNVYTFPDASEGVVDMVAGVSRRRANDVNSVPGSPVLTVFYRTQAAPDQLQVAVAGAGQTPSFTTSSVPWSGKAGPLQISVGFDDGLLVAAMLESSSLTSNDGKLYVWTDCLWGQQAAPTYGSLTGFSYTTSGTPGPLAPTWSAVVMKVGSGQPQVMLALPNGTYGPYKVLKTSITPPAVTVWTWSLTTDGPINAAMGFPGIYPPVPSTTTTAYAVEYASALGSYNYATLVVRTLDTAGGASHQRLWVASPASAGGGNPQWTWTELQLPNSITPSTDVTLSVGISPLPASETVGSPENDEAAARRFMDTFVLAGSDFSVIRQAPQGNADQDYAKPAYTPAIPMQTGIAAMTSQANVSTGNELLLVDQDGTLQYLVKDPVSGVWVDNPVHLPADDVEETSTYRITLGVVDAWQMPVPNHTLQVSAASQVTALVNGSALTLTDTSTNVTTDEDGQVIIALLADGLGAPSLTVSGDGIGTTTVNPSAAVNTFLQGDTTLNYLPALTGATLAAAKAPDGTVLALGASDSGAAQDAVTTMAQAAGQATQGNGTLTLSPRRVRNTPRRDGNLTSTSQLTGVLSDLDKWSNDALHAIKKGALAVKDVAYDAEQKVFTISCDVANWAGNAVTVVVKTLQDAAHVVHALLVKLGADIKKAILWARAEVTSLLQDAAALGDQYLSWLTECCTFVAKQITASETKIDSWLTSTQATVVNTLTTIANSYASSTTLDTMTDNPPKGAATTVRSARGSGLGAGDGSDISQLLHGDWFYSKIKNELSGELALPTITDLVPQLKSLVTDAAAALSDMWAAYQGFWHFLESAITNPHTVMKVLIHGLLTALANLMNAVFELARRLCDGLLGVLTEVFTAIPAILQTKANTTPLLGGLMTKIGRTNTTVGQHAATHFAFRAVLVYRLANGGQGRPFGGQQAVRGRLGSGSESRDLKICAGTAIDAWAFADFRAQGDAVLEAVGINGKGTGFLSTAIDIAAPIIVGVLTTPATDNGQPFFAPPVTSSSTGSDLLNFLAWICSMTPGLFTAVDYYWDKTADGADQDLPGQKRMCAFGTFVSGALSLAFGCAGNHDSSAPTGSGYAVSVLTNMAYLVTPLLDDELVEATEGITAAIAAITTLLTGNAGGDTYAAS